MAGLDVAASAVGIASLGIQVCQGLLGYYDDWKAYKDDMQETYTSIAELQKTFHLLEETLSDPVLPKDRAVRASECLSSCNEGITYLQTKVDKLRRFEAPKGSRQRSWAEMQRLWYPFRAKTLTKLQSTVKDLMRRLSLALQVLQLDMSTASRSTLLKLKDDMQGLSIKTSASLADTHAMVPQIKATADHVEAIRATQQVILTTQQAKHLRNILGWLAPPDPFQNHAAARARHEPKTGKWLLRSPEYQQWKNNSGSSLWLHGQAGSGKTVLCSTVIEDVQALRNTPNTGSAFFYFSFSESQKQNYTGLLLSLLSQLCRGRPVGSQLQQVYDKYYPGKPTVKDLENVLVSVVVDLDQAFILIDALDECPDKDDDRSDVLAGLERILQSCNKLSLLMTSRKERDIQDCMRSMSVPEVSINTALANADIRRYVKAEFEKSPKLKGFSGETKHKIQEVFQEKAGGMFRWAFCQLEDIKKLKIKTPKYIEYALNNLPRTLDETYERMLLRIDEICSAEACSALKWLAFSERPLTLAELKDAWITNPDRDPTVDEDNRPETDELLDVLSGLITEADSEDDDEYSIGEQGYADLETDDSADPEDDGPLSDDQRSQPDARSTVSDRCTISRDRDSFQIRLAHFSVKEYLVSPRIQESKAARFAMKESIVQHFLSQSCVAYIIHYSRSSSKTGTEDDLEVLPLLDYAARSWYTHLLKPVNLRLEDEEGLEKILLSTDTVMEDWLNVHDPTAPRESFQKDRTFALPLYYASYMGIVPAVRRLLLDGAHVNALGGTYWNALQAASHEGHETIVRMLIESGADVNTQGGTYGHALQAASRNGHDTTVSALLESGADVNAQGGVYGNALQAASWGGHDKIVEMLIDRGVDVNAQGGEYGNALQAASWCGHDKIVEMLIDKDVDVNAQGGFCGNALHAASWGGHDKVVKTLIDSGADINVQGGTYGNALQAASCNGHDAIVQMLIDKDVDVNAQGGVFGTALCAASCRGHETIVEILLSVGADINAKITDIVAWFSVGPTALHSASWEGHWRIVEILLSNGADINAVDSCGRTALCRAAVGRYSQGTVTRSKANQGRVVEMLMLNGADVNATSSNGETALYNAVKGTYRYEERDSVVEILLCNGADINAKGPKGTALEVARLNGLDEIIKILEEASMQALASTTEQLNLASQPAPSSTEPQPQSTRFQSSDRFETAPEAAT